MKTVLLALIRLYQAAVSPMLGVACRYEPSCSAYAHEAIERHGAWRGLRLAASRLSRCRPGGGGGWDPVPDSIDRANGSTVTNAAPQSPSADAKVPR